MDESKVEKKRGKKVGIPENLLDEVIEKSLQTHHNTLGHDETTKPRVDDGPEEAQVLVPASAAAEISAAADASPVKTRKRGRPPGVKNKKPSPRRRLLDTFPVKTRKRGRPPTEKKKSSPDKMVRFTTCISTDLIERMKNCVYYSPGMTVTEVISSGVRKQLHLLEKKNRGVFKDRPSSRLSPGRKIK